jgi:hypothetical protein
LQLAAPFLSVVPLAQIRRLCLPPWRWLPLSCACPAWALLRVPGSGPALLRSPCWPVPPRLARRCPGRLAAAPLSPSGLACSAAPWPPWLVVVLLFSSCRRPARPVPWPWPGAPWLLVCGCWPGRVVSLGRLLPRVGVSVPGGPLSSPVAPLVGLGSRLALLLRLPLVSFRSFRCCYVLSFPFPWSARPLRLPLRLACVSALPLFPAFQLRRRAGVLFWFLHPGLPLCPALVLPPGCVRCRALRWSLVGVRAVLLGLFPLARGRRVCLSCVWGCARLAPFAGPGWSLALVPIFTRGV